MADDPECARESPVCRAYRVGSCPVEREMALLDLIGWGFSYSISKTPSTRINANSVTWCFIHEKLALLGKTEIEYEKAQSASSGDNVSVFASVKSWDEPASLVRRSADILVKRAGNGEDTRELARILHCCPIRPLDAGERENAAGLVVGLDVGLHVVANAGAPLGGGGIYRVCAPGPACRGLRSRSSVRRSTLRYRSRPAVCSLARRPRV